MRCKLCGKSTGKLIATCHPECEQKLHKDFTDNVCSVVRLMADIGFKR